MRKLIALAASAAMTAALFNCMPLGASALTAAETSLGDVNGDGMVNASDASSILAYYSVLSTGGDIIAGVSGVPVFGDMNNDGSVNASDASYVLGYYTYAATGGASSAEDYMSAVTTPKDVRMYTYGTTKMKADNSVDIRWQSYENNDYFLKQISDNCRISGYKIKMFSRKYDSASDTSTTTELASYEVRDAKDIEEKNSYDDSTTVYKVANVKLPDGFSCDPDLDYGYSISAIASIAGIEVDVETHQEVTFNKVELIVNTAKLTPHDSYPLYNIKVNPPVHKDTYYVSAADKQILDQFAKEHFTPDMTNYDKIECAWRWVNQNITYASGNLYYDIIADSWVSACFVKKKGQCLQYNGALAELLAYMGYDVYMLEMWLGENGTNQHFRTEVNIDGRAYSIEVGNDGAYSGWMWLFQPIESSIKGVK